MRTLIPAIALAIALATATGVRAGPMRAPVPGFEASVLTTQVDGMLEIDDKGRVVAYTIGDARKLLAPAVVDSLTAQVRGWTFEPVQVDGKPVIARARMRVTLLAQEDADGFVVSIDNVTFPPLRGAVTPDSEPVPQMRIAKYSRPRYPEEFLARALEATVLVSMKLDPDGRVAEAAIVQTSIPDRVGKPEEFGRLAALLEAEVLRAVPRMKIEVLYPEGAEASGKPLTGLLPIMFHMGTRQKKAQGQWRTETRSTKRTPPWVSIADGRQLAGVSDLNDGETATAEGGLRLKQAVNGAIL